MLKEGNMIPVLLFRLFGLFAASFSEALTEEVGGT